jgi:hypothetical protein
LLRSAQVENYVTTIIGTLKKCISDSTMNKGQSIFWTAGHRLDSSNWNWWTNRFMWCSLENSSELSRETVSWKNGQPENEGENPNCVQLRIHKYSTGSYTVISDQHCSLKFAFACQVNNKY